MLQIVSLLLTLNNKTMTFITEPIIITSPGLEGIEQLTDHLFDMSQQFLKSKGIEGRQMVQMMQQVQDHIDHISEVLSTVDDSE